MGREVLMFGFNGVGSEVARRLSAKKIPFTVADHDETRLSAAAEAGYYVASAHPEDDEALARAGIGDGTKVLFCLYDEEAYNVFLVISARALDPALTIIAVARSADGVGKLKAAGASKVIDPYEISGRKIWDILRRPVIDEIMEKTVFGEENLNMAQLPVGEGSFVVGKYLHELRLNRSYDVVVIGIVDRELGEELFMMTGSLKHKLDPGDILVAIGSGEELERLRKDLSPASR